VTSGPNRLADKIRDDLDALGAQLEEARGKEQRSPLNKQMHTLKAMLAWCETRAGYVPTGEEMRRGS
jgi:hypothetical protein